MNTEEKLNILIKKRSFIFKYVPFLSAVYLCNSLSFSRSSKESDIDFFVLSKSKRLFTARFFLTIFTHFLRFRRHGTFIKNRFCLSFFADGSYLNLENLQKGKDYYLAYWIYKLIPVFLDGLDKNQHLKSNSWIFELVEGKEKSSFNTSFVSLRKSGFILIFEKILNGFFGDLLEKLFMTIQLFFIKRKFKNLFVSEKDIVFDNQYLKFHNNDRRDYYNALFVEKNPRSKISDQNYLTIF